ncbi:hypothetical protein FOXB_11245 [Fusarium oxysporum f. sp. conglutinans Fo5176]|uniref:Uncharacterized protein n=1 Tax=Fusarium oxysporum (strain Fo5176) TaxID=660025 RepID=F9FXW3_FUSOF|nr:hypothetical protein FOXB_11245 [Fusarium oxysporum f. sp. conglutinans Fo5176]
MSILTSILKYSFKINILL